MVPPKFEELKFSEQKVFLEELDKQLVSNLKHQLKEYDKLTGGNVKVTSVNELNAADLISKNQKEILNLSQEYLAKLNTLSDINIELYKKMSEWVDIRLGLMLQKTHNDVSCSVLKGKLLELKEKYSLLLF